MCHNGIKQIIMLTGDNRHTAQAVAEQLGLDAFHAELLPEDKVRFVKQLNHREIVIVDLDGLLFL